VIIALAVTVGVLYATGTYLLLQRTLTRIVMGLALMGHGVNLLLLMAGGRAGAPPLVGSGEVAVETYADPLPQAMALTAIVITFGITAFLLALAYRSWTLTHNDEVEDDIEDRRIADLARQNPDVPELRGLDVTIEGRELP
jgi:multicomponent Na+:H+ antiporter subunit C